MSNTHNRRFGYACQNLSLREDNSGFTCSKTMRKKTFKEKGLPYVSELALKNINNLFKILKWNKAHDVTLFRITSDLFPWMTKYRYEDLPDWPEIEDLLARVGEYILDNKMRVTQHPDHFVKLGTEDNPELVNQSRQTLNQQARVFDLMGLDKSVEYAINIHVGGAYGDKEATMKRFSNEVNLLSDSVKLRLTVENDDKQSLYTVKDLYEGVYQRTEVPIMFDSLHWKCHPGGQSHDQALWLARSTWPDDVDQLVHHSNSKAEIDETSRDNAHTDYYHTAFESSEKMHIDVMLESKAKDKALLQYREDYL